MVGVDGSRGPPPVGPGQGAGRGPGGVLPSCCALSVVDSLVLVTLVGLVTLVDTGALVTAAVTRAFAPIDTVSPHSWGGDHRHHGEDRSSTRPGGPALGAEPGVSDFLNDINNLALNRFRGSEYLGRIQIDCRPLSGRLNGIVPDVARLDA